jgi:hypothetical protein
MFASNTNNPSSGVYPYSVDNSALFALLAKETANQLVKNKQEFVDNFASRFFNRAIAEGAVIGSDGRPVQPSPEQLKAWMAEYKVGLLNQLLKDEKERLQESSQQHLAEATRLKESSEKKFAQVEKLDQEIITKQFWSIFNGKNQPSQDQYSEIFATYLADRSLTIEETPEGKGFGRINSMSSVIKYLTNNPLTKMCDFRHFKTEVNDVETLADFLKTPDAYAVKALAFKTAISEIAKQKLAEAVSARASTPSPLKVQYFA